MTSRRLCGGQRVRPLRAGLSWEKLTESIMAALNSTLGIPEDRTYIRYTATTDWGWNGSNF